MPIFLISIVVLTVSIQPATDITAADLDLSNIKDANDKKKRFFDFMRPIINDENARVLALREKLLDAKKNKNKHGLVSIIAEDYSVEWTTDKQNWEKLLERVDAISLEIALAQSATESAWGQSRFAKQGNNFFGQWCYIKGCGIIPSERDRNSTHEVARFNSVNDSVRSYIKTINTGRVYTTLRKIRRDDRATGKQPDADAQASGLVKYSQRREAYVKEIRAMIQVNKKLMLGRSI